MIIAKLIGESDGHVVSRQFSDLDQAKRWAQSDGLVDFNDQTARGEAWENGELRWTRANLQTAEQRDRDIRRFAVNKLARWGITQKKGYL